MHILVHLMASLQVSETLLIFLNSFFFLFFSLGILIDISSKFVDSFLCQVKSAVELDKEDFFFPDFTYFTFQHQNLFLFYKKRIIFVVLLSFKGIVVLKNFSCERTERKGQMEVLGIEPRALCMQSTCSTTELHPLFP